MADAIKVTVLLFAALKDLVGAERVTVDVPPETPVGAIWAYVPMLSDTPPPTALRYAVNHEWADPDLATRNGDEVAFVLPVSGG